MARKSVIKAKKPAAKTIVRKSVKPPVKTETKACGLALPANKRVITAEGLKRKLHAKKAK